MEEEYMTGSLENGSEQDKNQEEYHVIYCGPNIPAEGLFTYQIYIGGLPVNVRKAIERIPEIEKMLVPVSKCAEMRAGIKHKGTAENIIYERIRGKVMK